MKFRNILQFRDHARRAASSPPRPADHIGVPPPGWVRALSVAGFFAILTIVNSFPLAITPGAIIGQHGDAMFSVWRLAWVAHQLRTDPRHLFDGNIFHPERATLAYSDAMLLPGTVLAPLNWAGIDPVVVYNVTLILAFFLSALTAYLLVRRLTGSVPAGLLAGIVFAFSAHRFDHFDHLELQFAFWIPLAMLAWHQAVTDDVARGYLKVAALVGCQVLSSIYHGLFLVTWLAVMTTVWFARTPLKAAKAGALILLPPLLVLAAYSLPYLENRGHLGDRPIDENRAYSARMSDFRSAHDSSVLYGWTEPSGAPERHFFPGIAAAVLVIVGLWPPFDRIRLLYAAGAAVALQLALGFNGLIYPWLYEWVVPFRGLRVPARADILILLATGVLAGFGLARLIATVRRRSLATAIAALTIAVASIESLARPQFQEVDRRVSHWYPWLRTIPDAVVFEWPVTVPWRLYDMLDVKYMYRSTLHWRPLLNGYSGHFPPSYTELLLVAQSFPDTESLTYLQQRGATVLVVHEVPGRTDSYEETVQLLTRDPNVRVIARDRDAGSRVTFFRLYGSSRPPASASFCAACEASWAAEREQVTSRSASSLAREQ